jgi:hypothetical protein
VRLFPVEFLGKDSHGPQPPVAPSAGVYVHVLALELPRISLWPTGAPEPCGPDAPTGLLAMVYNWFAEPFADSERMLFYSRHAWLSL